MNADLNYWMILIAAIIYYAGGILWYSPILFGEIWASLEGNSVEQMKRKGMWKSYFCAFLLALLMSYIMATIIHYTKADTLIKGLGTGFICWIGFVITTSGANSLFIGKPLKLLLINSGYHLYGLLVMGAIFAV